MLSRRYSLRSEPQNPTGAPLDVRFEIVLPESTVNLWTNPSFETGTSNVTASSDGSGGTPFQRSTAAQFRGAYSAQLTVRPTGGTYVQLVGPTISNATMYALSFHVRRPNRGNIHAGIVRAYVNGGLVDFDTYEYVSNGWWRVTKVFTSTGTTAPGIRVLGSPGAIFYVDACQLEAKGYPTTYCDGDEMGLLPVESPPAYYWTGAPHASTSVRSAATRAGGQPVNVKQYGLTVLALIGLGFSQRSVISTPLGLADGSLYQRTIRDARVFTVAGSFEGSGPRDVSAKRGDLRAALVHDLSGLDQPVTLRLQRYDLGEPIGDQVTLAASYLEGLGEDMNQPFDEKVSVQFEAFLPALVSSGSRGTTLSTQSSLASVTYIAQRSNAGVWGNLSANANGSVKGFAAGPNQVVYTVGDFTQMGGLSANRIAAYNSSTGAWSLLGTGANAGVNAVAVAPNGNVYAAGAFTTMGGGGANRIAVWNGASWSALGSGLDDTANAVIVAPDGTVYAAGLFLNAGGGAAARVAVWNGASWAALGAGLDGIVNTLAFGPDGSLYAGGAFTGRVARWNGSSWSVVGGGMDSTNVYALLTGPDGMIYAGGNFTTAGGVSASRIARWNGTAWQPLGAGVSDAVYALTFDGDGALIASGVFTSAGGVLLPDTMARWNGASWAPVAIDLPGSAFPRAILGLQSGALFVGFETSGTATTPSVTTVSNPGTVPTGIRLTITGPTSGSARVYSLTNNTTGKAIYFDLTLQAGETAYLTATGNALNLRTTFRGAYNSAFLPVSNPDFALVKGENSLSFLTGSSTMTATLSFTPQYESLDDATMAPGR